MILLKQGGDEGDICPVCPPPHYPTNAGHLLFMTLNANVCFMSHGIQQPIILSLIKKGLLFIFCVLIDNSKATGKIVVRYFSYFPKQHFEKIEAAQLQRNYFWSMELLQGCWYKGGGLYSAKAVKRWKRTRRQWKPIKVEQREPSPLKAYYKSLSIISSSEHQKNGGSHNNLQLIQQ